MRPLAIIADWARRTWQGLWQHVDRIKPIDVARAYGSQALEATRPPKQEFDLQCVDVNANVSIAIRAYADAIKSLPLNIVTTQTIAGVDREVDDNEHPANAIIDNPNPDMTMREVISHVVKSLLGDGNAYLTIERQTGPNDGMEIWPRDPRVVTPQIPGGKLSGYKFKWDDKEFIYPKTRVVHIRDVNPAEPFLGKPRFEAVRVEIFMDYLVNEFNKNFFKNGATLNLMFTPSTNLGRAQHEAMLDQFEKFKGAERSFKLLINQFAGKLESPDMKHKDIAFGELLKHNREKIFGAFGLPPFRGGVMEYANYANALAQDKDFWHNSVWPLTCMIEDAINKQLIWRYFGREVSMKFDFGVIAALKGEPKERAEIHEIYIRNKVMSPRQVCEDLGIEPPDESEFGDTKPPSDEKPAAEKDPGDEDAPPKPTRDEEKDAQNAVLKFFSMQRRDIRVRLREYLLGGAHMSKLILEERAADHVFPMMEELDRADRSIGPTLMAIYRARVIRSMDRLGRSLHEFSADDSEEKHSGAVRLLLDTANGESRRMLIALMRDAIRYRWDVNQLNRKIASLFTEERARYLSGRLLGDTVRRAEDPRSICMV